jgi:hypothetical protein
VFSDLGSTPLPAGSLFFFYLFITFCFLGWVVYGLQKSPESILLGYRILYAALALLPASWYWFYSALSNEKADWLSWAITGLAFSGRYSPLGEDLLWTSWKLTKLL